jgi:hypothetical protein
MHQQSVFPLTRSILPSPLLWQKAGLSVTHTLCTRPLCAQQQQLLHCRK